MKNIYPRRNVHEKSERRVVLARTLLNQLAEEPRAQLIRTHRWGRSLRDSLAHGTKARQFAREVGGRTQ